MAKENYFIIRPFGPSIVKLKMPESLVANLNDYVDKIINDEKKSSELDYGKQLAGMVTQEFKIEKNFMKEAGLENFLAGACEKWIQLVYRKKISKFEIISSWIVRQFKNEYNPTHWHGGHISGVGYLKVPNTLGLTKKDKEKSNINGCLQLIHGSKMFMSESIYTAKPEVGDFYLFPNYLMHTVFPFADTDEERRSISFNASVDNEIYNVYG
tara:strand:+ start:231 stop:866 length:636 start_codon:yes stop_codon:yes gene_type:complete